MFAVGALVILEASRVHVMEFYDMSLNGLPSLFFFTSNNRYIFQKLAVNVMGPKGPPDKKLLVLLTLLKGWL